MTWSQMRPKNLAKLKKTLQKRKAWATATSSKKARFMEPNPREVLAEPAS